MFRQAAMDSRVTELHSIMSIANIDGGVQHTSCRMSGWWQGMVEHPDLHAFRRALAGPRAKRGVLIPTS
jgi:restriction endonuclease Mrr